MNVRVPPGLQLESDVSPADWIVEKLWPWDPGRVRLGSFMPDGFEAYARLLPPLHRVEGEPSLVRWDAIVARLLRPIAPETGLREVFGFESGDLAALKEFDPPLEGCMPIEETAALASLLSGFSQTQDRAWFCVWDGYGIFGESSAVATLVAKRWPRWHRWRARRRGHAASRREWRARSRTPKVHTPHRDYLLFSGAVASATSFQFGMFGWQSPNLWWPDDRAWCVITEVDGYSSYVGGSRVCIDHVLNSIYVEAIEVSIDVRMDPGPY
jgi:hypothetical protein